MNWQQLYSTRRTGDRDVRRINPDPVRSSFVRDYDRIIFSSPFRRLQNKTQVFPLPGAIFVHNRLTHSLEVASVGRSLGKAVGDMIADRHPGSGTEFEEFYRHELASVISAACLAHDIGNPPFGHSGEDAIRAFFSELGGSDRDILNERLTLNQWKDLEFFEGNSNALRILTTSFNEPEPGGYKLTFSTLAAIVKYPCSSSEGFNKGTGLIATKKSGFFDTEVAVFADIAQELGLHRTAGFETVYARHPFVYLTEAADDICYRVIDLEDAHRLRIINTETFMDMFLPFFDQETVSYNTRDYINGKLARINDRNQKVQYVRARWIGLMTDKLAEVYMAHEAQLLEGTLQCDLLKCLPGPYLELIDRINDFSYEHIYNHKTVSELEIAGYHVIGGLLREFVHAALNPGSTKARKLLKLVSAQFAIEGGKENAYTNVQSMVDFVSGMTDLYALDLYRKISGISIPEIR